MKNTAYYNYYNNPYRYTPDMPKTPGWKEELKVVKDQVKSSNHDPENERYKAYEKLEDIYYAMGVRNRTKYTTESQVKTALYDKYYHSDYYKQFSELEVTAMYDNELAMTLFGCLNGGGNLDDPHLKGEVRDVTEKQAHEYNRKTINMQLCNIFENAGISSDLLNKYNMTFSIDPYNYSLKVLGVDDAGLTAMLEKLLNKDNNSRELFYHILHSNRASISENAKAKYHTLNSFVSVTGQDPRQYRQTEAGLVNDKGENILDVYREALKTSDAVPAQFKGDAYRVFEENIKKLLAEGFYNIPDLNLSIGYKDGMLQDLSNEDIMHNRFDQTV
ncbi:MAG: DUF4885 domain-containing protein [Lachnospiraceae bacterium]|nr:DUF4885 domain-containing protein [Lachnospiraceae bacterium]